ncbi:MAG: carbohydrate kinase [Candidatus Levybacteria bacterium]|nr:carbohydrate kinase [Candidatus Levybacteria bacterium]
MKQIVCFGELLIDMISSNVGDLKDSEGFLKKFGGAPANTAVGLAKLGLSAKFIGKVGNDPFGLFLKEILDDNNVDTKNLILSKKEKTSLAFVSLTETGERSFSFYKGAHDAISETEVSLLKSVYLFHFGSLTQISDGPKKATEKLIKQARKNKIIISYDPNIREALWVNLNKAKKIILETSKKVQIFKLNEEEAIFLSGEKNIPQAAEKLFTKNLDALFITLGKNGCYYKTKKYKGQVSMPIKINVVDTTGAGDAFNAGYIYGIIQSKKTISQMNQKDLESILQKSNIIAGLTTTKKGAITAFPSKHSLTKFIKQIALTL